jgi:parallel beta-helix repeat protein
VHKRLIAALLAVVLSCLVLLTLFYTGFFSINLPDFIDNTATPEVTAGFSSQDRRDASIVVPDDYENISLAVANAKSGDVIFVRSGVYKGSITVDKPVTLQGENKETTIVEGLSGGDPAFLVKSDNVTITGFKTRTTTQDMGVSESRGRVACIHLLSVNNCSVTGNIMVNSGKGVWIYQGSQNKIVANQFVLNNFGVLVESSTGNVVVDNTMQDGWYGVVVDSSFSNTVKNNELSNNVCGLSVDGMTLQALSSNNIDCSNTVDDKKVYYLTDQTGLIIDPVGYPDLGALILVNCRDVTVRNLALKNNIELVNTSDSEVTHNTVANSNAGILLYYSNNCKITDNTLKNIPIFGIYLLASNCTLVKDNYIEQTQSILDISKMVVFVNSHNNNLTQNTFVASGYTFPTCVDLVASSNNQITNNTQTGGSVTNAFVIQSNSNSNHVSNNNFNISFGYSGVSINNSTYNIVTHNVFGNFDVGFNFYNSMHNTLTENAIFYLREPFSTTNSTDNIDNNQFTQTSRYP